MNSGMKILVIGSGGREHAIVKYLSSSRHSPKLFCIPGNPGIHRLAECYSIPFDSKDILHFCQNKQIELVIIGPEEPLINGLSDELRKNNILVVGPSQIAAQLEGSKSASKIFMKKHGIPTSEFVVVDNVKDCLEAANKFTPPFVLKADGLAAGKGVFICDSLNELKAAATEIFENKILGESGSKAVLEQHIAGFELSYLIATNGKDYHPLPLAKDHKRLLDGDKGPNTGGMGTIAPIQIVQDLHDKIHKLVLEPTCEGLSKDQLLYRGILFVGLMIDKDLNPYVLEYNCRFGDPETQVVLPLLNIDSVDFFYPLAKGEVPAISTSEDKYACCVILASPEYPAKNTLRPAILGDAYAHADTTYFLHAGTQSQKDQLIASGGRVLCSVAIESELKTAIVNAYEQVKKVSWKGMQYRKDIGLSD